MALPEQYDPLSREQHWRRFWDEHDVYAFENVQPVFSIDTPPPTVSGKMHIGHAFSYTQGDIIGRYKRMAGYSVFYPFGTDDNGLPTERLVEKHKAVRATKMDRGEFRKLCLKTVKELLPEFVQAWKDIAMSADFKASYSTIDEHSQRVSQRSFLDLLQKKLVYRADNPVAWCPQCQTAIAQAEFESVEQSSLFNDITFDCEGKRLTIATTRPELIPACVALTFHPDDDRYKGLVGKAATVPLTNREVPIIADPDVVMDKGSGLMMVCTFGDKEDIEKWRRHNLKLRVILGRDGKLSELAGKYKDLSIKEARKAILQDLKEKNLLTNQKQITHAVNTHERCGTEIEFLKTTQWFVNVLDHKEELLAAGKAINWYPEHMRVRYEHWVENLNWDWAISRQRFYGVPFPVWYSKRKGEESKILTPNDKDLPVDPLADLPHGYTRDEIEPEYDVMDTWATSSSTPHVALGWDSELSKEHFPMSLRLQAHDIIRTWAFYTIVKAKYNFGTVPWRDIVISGHALDSKGEKMSKSKGNVIDPIQVMATHGTDALRWWAGGSKLGDDLAWQEKDLVNARRTVTKLFNAGRFTIQNIAGHDHAAVEPELLDRWLLHKLNETITECTAAFDSYEYSKARAAAEQFFWSSYCDLYLELVKDRIYNADRGEAGKAAAQHTLYQSFLAVLKLFAPFMPHITEELYQAYFRHHDGSVSVHVSAWPTARDEWVDEAAEKAGDTLVTLLSAVRKYRSERKLGMKSPLNRLTIQCSDTTRKSIEAGIPDLQAAANVADIVWVESEGLSWDVE